MLIRYGCELSLVVVNPTAMYALVDIHPDRRIDIVEEQPLRTSPRAALTHVPDAFANTMQRLTVPPGETSLVLSGVIRDSGVPEARDPDAIIRPVIDLPPDVAMYLNGSRYCETDKLGAIAWNTFGHLPAGTRMVEAICDFVHERLLRLPAGAVDPHRARGL